VCKTLWRFHTNWIVILDIHISGEHIHCIRLWQSGTGCLALALFIHSLWVVFRLRIDNRSNYENCQNLCQPLSKRPRDGSLCFVEVVTRYGTFGIQSACFCKLEIVDLICGDIDCQHKLVDWFVWSGDLNDHLLYISGLNVCGLPNWQIFPFLMKGCSFIGLKPVFKCLICMKVMGFKVI